MAVTDLDRPPEGKSRAGRYLLAIAVAVMLAVACVQGPWPSPPPGDFSGPRARQHVVALSEIGPRPPGGDGAAKARIYLEKSLRKIGVSEVREVRFPLAGDAAARDPGTPVGEGVHLLGVLPGESHDVLVLAAPYDTVELEPPSSEAAVNSASGAALVLELGRALSERVRPYTLWLVFLDAEAVPAGAHPSRQRFHGSEHWAEVLESSGTLDRVRVALYFDDVADPGRPVARDMRSHSIYRDVFWEVAEEQGRDREFPAAGNLRSPRGGHRVLLDRGVTRVVAIVGERPGAAGSTQRGASGRTPAHSLVAVGEVSVEAIDRIAGHLEKVDRFSARPEEVPSEGVGTSLAPAESN